MSKMPVSPDHVGSELTEESEAKKSMLEKASE